MKWKKGLSMVLAGFVMFGLGFIASDIHDDGVRGTMAKAAEANVAKQLRNYIPVTKVVEEGDTVWALQRELNPDLPAADASAIFPYLNNGKRPGDIQPGEVVFLLKAKEQK